MVADRIIHKAFGISVGPRFLVLDITSSCLHNRCRSCMPRFIAAFGLLQYILLFRASNIGSTSLVDSYALQPLSQNLFKINLEYFGNSANSSVLQNQWCRRNLSTVLQNFVVMRRDPMTIVHFLGDVKASSVGFARSVTSCVRQRLRRHDISWRHL
jgi:hypothetical protein